ncbi:AAA family ATPase [Frankia sp. AiPs1]|uniref:AAA family ATPase n=1 Tax=Frankia sp. AiPs1 TaxID=573493 RepID=UPI002043AEF9|nr:AAA family ATPase [Frankia sp. AiPs1]MCM3921081.1 AAA family ATPase [Frankia sp. AiPs1]
MSTEDNVVTEAPGWWLFRGTGRPLDPAERDARWPSPPPWRDFDGGPLLAPPATDEREARRRLGRTPSPLLKPVHISLVNAAIHLRRPLLVNGPPGVGKSGLAFLIASELGLGNVLKWPITSRTTIRDGLYEYDAIGRAQAAVQARGAPTHRLARARPEESTSGNRGPVATSIGEYIRLGPLGTALLPQRLPRVLLVDELDKSDFAFANDLLNIFEDGEFLLPELSRLGAAAPEVEVHTADQQRTAVVSDGVVRCKAFPIVVMTSNREREFSPAFRRRCTLLDLPHPDTAGLAALVAAHFPADSPSRAQLIERFERRREQVGGGLAADQLLNAAHLAAAGAFDGDEATWLDLLEAVWHELSPPLGTW